MNINEVGPNELLTVRFRLPLPASQDLIDLTIQEVEQRWWDMIGEKRIVVTELPITGVLKLGKDLPAMIDSQLPQPYDYEPPMVLSIQTQGRGRVDIRTPPYKEK